MFSQKYEKRTAKRMHLIVTQKDREKLDWYMASLAGLGC